MKITRRVVLAKLLYDPGTGMFTHRIGRYAGLRAGSSGKHQEGRIQIRVGPTQMFYAHRLAWLIVKGTWPPNEIDHINRDPSDNQFVNLRLATKAENRQNIEPLSKANSSGLRGVYRHSINKRWCAQITVDDKQTYLGSFRTKLAAHLAYLEAKKRLHPFGEDSRVE